MRDTCRMSALRQCPGEMLPVARVAVAEQGTPPADPLFMRCLAMDMEQETLGFEAGFALAAPFADAPKCAPEAGRAARSPSFGASGQGTISVPATIDSPMAGRPRAAAQR